MAGSRKRHHKQYAVCINRWQQQEHQWNDFLKENSMLTNRMTRKPDHLVAFETQIFHFSKNKETRAHRHRNATQRLKKNNTKMKHNKHNSMRQLMSWASHYAMARVIDHFKESFFSSSQTKSSNEPPHDRYCTSTVNKQNIVRSTQRFRKSQKN